ncbi:putative bifunctional diguanylate cyclase/phosphodiesterase [Pseudohoeflea coraliihabitans]|uniref:EAL domain-containing protein n=1 Tax=Pseudohoeflea coraliihabitans TaxID=2860393 RepID=A0ABS6WLT8_9HYPH|nr:EAL domain-containing protein [Pseudohoeflea sp. DP4N28-3]MBW3096924.1 EAL domain-containing protein [Pseudohoeflea sp. DP4N28-3]
MRQSWRVLMALVISVIALIGASLMLAGAAQALEPVRISREATALDLTATTEIYRGRGEAFQVSTAPGADGIVRRIEVRSSTPEHSGDWAVFALANVSEEQLDRLIVAPHFRLVNSGLAWPDLGSKRILSITPSEGFALDQVPSDEDDVYRITLNPGSVVTFVAELATPELPQIYLWEPDAYKDTVNAFTLYRGVVLGIAGLLAVFLTILFVVKGTSMLPATAALAWAVLAYVSVDFGFLSKLISITPGDEQIWRAGTEVFLATGLVLFLFAYLNLNRWHINLAFAMAAWLFGLAGLFAVAIYDPQVAAGIARLSLGATAAAGLGLIVYLGVNRYDRAIMLVPTWVLVLFWVVAAWMTISGRLSNDIAQPALGGALVLIVLLLGFTVVQHSFAGGAFHQGLFSDMERQALALSGSGDTVWDWDVLRNKLVTIPDISPNFGYSPHHLSGPVRNWLPHVHPDDRDRFRTTLDALIEHRRGRLCHEFRIRAEDGHYHWLALRIRPVLGSTGEVIRCVGTIVDVTEQKVAETRLLHDAVHDNLTGLPNRQIFIDRLEMAIATAEAHPEVRPTVFMIDLDGFRKVNDKHGMSVGDTVLLALTRRLKRLLKPQDSLARISGDQFGLILLSEQDAGRVAALAEAVTKVISAPIDFAQQEIRLTASVGLVTWVGNEAVAEELMKDAELAMAQAKRFGGNRIEPFRPAFRTVGSNRQRLEQDLRKAIDRRELTLVYQPIVRMKDAEIAGFEALLRWEDAKRGTVSPSEFIPVAESSDLILQLGMYALRHAAEDLAEWMRAAGDLPIFMSVNLSTAQLLNIDLCADVIATIEDTRCDRRRFKLEVTESLVMHNPQQAMVTLQKLREAGIGLSLDDFGTGHSSLSYLTRFPFTTIKIDKALVSNPDERQAILLNSIVTLAKNLDMEIVAEGVANESDAAVLAEMGCDYAQSFIYGPPIGADAALRLLKERFPDAR